MSSCCDSDQLKEDEVVVAEKEPSSFIKRILYKIGKADAEKNKGKQQSSGGCCG